jgi:hypothetical protein
MSCWQRAGAALDRDLLGVHVVGDHGDPVDAVTAERSRVLPDPGFVGRRVDSEGVHDAVRVDHDVTVVPGDVVEVLARNPLRVASEFRELVLRDL